MKAQGSLEKSPVIHAIKVSGDVHPTGLTDLHPSLTEQVHSGSHRKCCGHKIHKISRGFQPGLHGCGRSYKENIKQSI